MFATIFDMSGPEKTEACKDLDRIEVQLGTAEITKLMNCSGNFTTAYKVAKALCQTNVTGTLNVTSGDSSPDVTAGDSSPDDTSGDSRHTCKLNMCNVATAQVLLMYASMVRTNIWM